MTAEEGAALMSRAVKLGMAVANIFFEAAEERREDGVLILLRKGVNLTAILHKLYGGRRHHRQSGCCFFDDGGDA